MKEAKTVETVERERERERAILLKNIACINYVLIFQKILNKINLKNKDPCYGLRLLHLRIQHRSFYILKCNQKYNTKMLAKDNVINYNKNVKNKNNVKINRNLQVTVSVALNNSKKQPNAGAYIF